MTKPLISLLEEKGAGKQTHERLGLSEADLERLYETMVVTRVLDEKMMNLQRSGRIGFFVPCMGQEATHIGAAFALDDDDWIFPHYRDTGIPVLRGVTIGDAMAANLRKAVARRA